MAELYNKKNLTDEQFEELKKLCALHITIVEAAGWFNIDEDTLQRNLKDKYKCSWKQFMEQYSTQGKVSLRRKQWELAMNGNSVMNVWLGKQWLDQSDKSTVTAGLNINPVQILLPDNGRTDPSPEGAAD
jgi:hypothetical protein